MQWFRYQWGWTTYPINLLTFVDIKRLGSIMSSCRTTGLIFVSGNGKTPQGMLLIPVALVRHLLWFASFQMKAESIMMVLWGDTAWAWCRCPTIGQASAGTIFPSEKAKEFGYGILELFPSTEDEEEVFASVEHIAWQDTKLRPIAASLLLADFHANGYSK